MENQLLVDGTFLQQVLGWSIPLVVLMRTFYTLPNEHLSSKILHTTYVYGLLYLKICGICALILFFTESETQAYAGAIWVLNALLQPLLLFYQFISR